MSIEAMKRALDALAALDTLFSPVARDSTQRVWIHEAKESIDALRTAIQQAESEPVLFVSPEQARAVTGKNRVHYTPSDNSGRYLPVRATPAGLFTQPLYTHPAPGVPEDVLRDAERYRWLRSEHERNDPICHLTWKRNMDRSEWRWVNTSVIDSSIDAAMLAASPAQKGGECLPIRGNQVTCSRGTGGCGIQHKGGD